MTNNTTRVLGKNGPHINPLGLGCMGMSEFYGPSDETNNITVLKRAIDLGCVFWDTADMYGCGKNEELLAKVLKEDRKKIFLCTKFGNVRGPNGEFAGVSGTPEPIEDTVRAMAELVKEGKVKYLGLSECSAATLRRAYAVHPIAAIQMEYQKRKKRGEEKRREEGEEEEEEKSEGKGGTIEEKRENISDINRYSPWSLEIESNGVLAAARELGVAIVAYSPLGRGFLSGQIKSLDDFKDPSDYRKHMPRFQGENFAKNLELVDRFQELAKKKGVTPSQYVLAWVLSQGPDFFAIPGTRHVKYLEENLGAAKVTILPEDNQQIRKLIESCTVFGERYGEQAAKTLDN